MADEQRLGTCDLEPTFDRDRYPTDETLEIIRNWPENWPKLMEFVHKSHYYPDWGWHEEDGQGLLDEPIRRIFFSTGGWSGNESLISAMKGNFIFWSLCWVQTRRGGHYIFELADSLTSKEGQ